MNHRQLAGIVLAATFAVVTAIAQTPAHNPPSPKPPDQAAPRGAEESQGGILGQPVNIKLDLTITDQTGPGDALKKVVTMVVADRGNGSIRSTGSVQKQGRVQINVDAYPTIVQNGAIRLRLGLEYNPRTLSTDSPTEWSSLNEQISVILDGGKPMVISQAADPASDRKIMVEVRATVMK